MATIRTTCDIAPNCYIVSCHSDGQLSEKQLTRILDRTLRQWDATVQRDAKAYSAVPQPWQKFCPGRANFPQAPQYFCPPVFALALVTDAE